MSSSAAACANLTDLTGCFFTLFDTRQAVCVLPDDENKNVFELCLVPFVLRKGIPLPDGDAEAIELLFVPCRRIPLPGVDADEAGAKSCSGLFVSYRGTPPSESSLEDPEDGRFF